MSTTFDGFTIIRKEYDGGAHIVVTGELDVSTAPQLRSVCEVDSPADVEVSLIDLADVTFMDRAGLQALLAVHARCGDDLAIILSPACARIIDIWGFRRRLPIIEG